MGLVALTRWPLRGTILEEYDSANYAFAVDKIDVEDHAPHPPGYILFVWASWAAHLFVKEPIEALATVNVVFGILTAALLYALLRLAMNRGEALVACLASLSAAHVWFQQTRPMEDSFAFGCILAAALGLCLALLGERRAVLPAFFLAGLVPGAKQLLALFLFPLALRTLIAWWKQDRRLALQAVGASLAGAAIWLVPLCYYTGGFVEYLLWGWGQVLWLDREALVTNTPILSHRMYSVFVTPFALPAYVWLWLPAAWGALVAWGERPRMRGLFWLVTPILLIRAFALGHWPRFSLYYLPFLLAFVVIAAVDLGRRAGRHVPLGARWRAALVAAVVSVALFTWAEDQMRYILPTMKTLHAGPSPVGEAIRMVQSRFNPQDTLLVVPSSHRVVLRQVEYYGRRAGYDVVEDRLLRGSDIRKRPHVLAVYGGGRPTVDNRWTGGIELLGGFMLPLMPRWVEISMWGEVWNVGVVEQEGMFLRFVHWTETDDGILEAGPRPGRIDVLRPSDAGFEVHLKVEPKDAVRGGRYRVNRRIWRRFSSSEEGIVLPIVAEDFAGSNVASIVIRPACAQADRRDCLRIRDWKLEENPAGRGPRDDRS